MDKVDYFVPENLQKEIELTSPTRKYRLIVGSYSTKQGCWNYSQGTVYEGDRLITTIQRNYGAFPWCFVEDHPDGHDYLFCGEDYQGQTVIQLDTGKRKDHLKKGLYSKGWCFCWASILAPSPSKTRLAVEGCHWACPYDVRIFDISNPLESLPCVWINCDYEQFEEWLSEDRVLLSREHWEGDDIPDEEYDENRDYETKKLKKEFTIDYSQPCEQEIEENKLDAEYLAELEKKDENRNGNGTRQ